MIKNYKEWLDHVIEKLKERPEVIDVELVGGVARGELESSHDVDLLVKVKGVKNVETFREELEKYLEERTGKKYPVHLHVKKE